jgi:hypothetical protein
LYVKLACPNEPEIKCIKYSTGCFIYYYASYPFGS